MAEVQLNEEEARIQKLETLKNKGICPYPYRFERTHDTISIVSNFEWLSSNETSVATCGRVLAIRRHGKTSFCHLGDEKGKIQIYLREDALQEKFPTLGAS